MAGLKSMTATSGPGISLYSEQISFAIGSEIPLVIVNVQRLGPSTGSATKGADGDIQFMRWGNSGGLPVIVLAPMNAADCYILTMHGFNLAEKYRCPVFIASNKEIGLTKESIDLDALEKPQIIERQKFRGKKGAFEPFFTLDDQCVPDFLPIGSNTLVRQTSSTHGTGGYITSDTREINKQRLRLQSKLQDNVHLFSYYEYFGVQNADALIITYGVTVRSALEAREMSRKNVSVLALKTLWPVPEDVIREIAMGYSAIYVVEMNLGQYVSEIEHILGKENVSFFGRMDGTLISPLEIKELIDEE